MSNEILSLEIDAPVDDFNQPTKFNIHENANFPQSNGNWYTRNANEDIVDILMFSCHWITHISVSACILCHIPNEFEIENTTETRKSAYNLSETFYALINVVRLAII